ncbi:MAG: hypothetical protein N2484_17700 [Clostridia bacterium]|nr:hypothetical protein [Clostridia bacterium]
MKVYLVVGSSGESLQQVLEKDGSIEVVYWANSIEDAFMHLLSNDVDFDVLLLMDQGIGASIESFVKTLSDFKELVDNVLPQIQFKFITKEPQYSDVFKRAVSQNPHFQVHLVDKVKIPVSFLKEICLGKKNTTLENTVLLSEQAQPQKRKSWLSFKKTSISSVRTSQSESEGHLPMKHERVKSAQEILPASLSGNLNRVIAVTGHRSSGITGTVSNLATEASLRGFTVIVLDLDLIYRGINLYFSKFGEEVDLNPELACSLIKCLLKPDSYSMNTCLINDNLYVSSLAYSVDRHDKILEHVNPKRLIALVSVLKTKFNLVMLDIPLEILGQNKELLLHVDSIGLCLNNSLYSILNTERTVHGVLDKDDLLLFKMKSKLILTKYVDTITHQGKALLPEVTSKILSSVSDTFDNCLACAGIVPFSKDFDQQIDTGRKLCSVSQDYRTCYAGILNNLL